VQEETFDSDFAMVFTLKNGKVRHTPQVGAAV
jgi:hypothetical protein